MIRWVARLLISFSIDSERPLPRWLKRWVQSDASLLEYLRQNDAMTDALRSAADDWAHDAAETEAELVLPEGQDAVGLSEATRSSTPPTSWPARWNAWGAGPRTAWLAGGTALAACLVLVIWKPWLGTDPDASRALDPGAESSGQAVDLRPVLASLAAGEEVFDKVAASAESWFSQAANWTEVIELQQSLTTVDQARLGLRDTGVGVAQFMNRWSRELASQTALPAMEDDSDVSTSPPVSAQDLR